MSGNIGTKTLPSNGTYVVDHDNDFIAFLCRYYYGCFCPEVTRIRLKLLVPLELR